MKKSIHPIAGIVALVTVVIFWLSTIFVGLFASRASSVALKIALPWGFLLLIPALLIAGGSGFALSRGYRKRIIESKIKRMPWIAANGILILVPAALFLAYKARSNEFDAIFYVIQALELLAGAVNIVLLGLNMRDGMKLRKKIS